MCIYSRCHLTTSWYALPSTTTTITVMLMMLPQTSLRSLRCLVVIISQEELEVTWHPCFRTTYDVGYLWDTLHAQAMPDIFTFLL